MGRPVVTSVAMPGSGDLFILSAPSGTGKTTLIQAMLRGVSAAVVGVLLAALYSPVWTAGVHTSAGFGLALAAFLALTLWTVPPWIVVVAGALVAAGLGALDVAL